jgi:hypothetical protein
MMTLSLREELILSQMPQVKLLGQRLHRRCPHVELDDLMSAGTIGSSKRLTIAGPRRFLAEVYNSRMIAAAEPISIHESTIASELTG